MKRLLLGIALLALTTGASALEFIEDDYAKAAAQAQAKNVPIFVEAWAPW